MNGSKRSPKIDEFSNLLDAIGGLSDDDSNSEQSNEENIFKHRMGELLSKQSGSKSTKSLKKPNLKSSSHKIIKKISGIKHRKNEIEEIKESGISSGQKSSDFKKNKDFIF